MGEAVGNYLIKLPEIDPAFAEVLFHHSSTRTIRPILDNRKVITEAFEPDHFSLEDGAELLTNDLVGLMYAGVNAGEDNPPIPGNSAIGINEYGFFYHSFPEEDLDYGYKDGWTTELARAGGKDNARFNLD